MLFHLLLYHLELKLTILFDCQILVRSIFTDFRHKLWILFISLDKSTSSDRISFVILVILHCINIESAGLFKTLILIHWFSCPKWNKNIRWTLWRLRLLASSKNSSNFLYLTVLHLRTTVFWFHHTDHLLFTTLFGYRRIVVYR